MRRALLPTLVTDASLTQHGSSSKQHVSFPQGAGGEKQPSAGKNKDQGLLSSSGQSGERDIFIKQTNQPTKKPQSATKHAECFKSGFHYPCSVHGSDLEISIWGWFGDKKMLWRMENSREQPCPGPEGAGHQLQS